METDSPAHVLPDAPSELAARTPLNFWKLWTANSFSNLGDGLYQVTIPLLAARLTDSPSLVAGVTVMSSLPWLIFALQAGSIVDRHDRRRVMLWVTLGRVLILAVLTLALINQSASMVMLYAAVLLLGIGETLADTSLQSIVPSIVSKDKLNWANARITGAMTVTNAFIGPPLAGFLVGIGFAVATGSSIGLYVGAGLALILMRGRFDAAPSNGGDKHNYFQHVTQGLRFLWNNRTIRTLTLFTASMNLFWSGWWAIFVLYAVKPGPMNLNEVEYGLILTSMAAGGLVGSALCERIRKLLGMRNALVIDLVGTVLFLGVPALTANLYAVGAATFFAGFGSSVWVILNSSIRQRVVPGDLLGRVYSASRSLSWGVGPIGALLAGFVSELWGIRTLFTIGAVFGIGLIVAFLALVSNESVEVFGEPA